MISNDGPGRSEFCNKVYAKDKMQNVRTCRLQTNFHQKYQKTKTRFKPIDEEDIMKKGNVDTT